MFAVPAYYALILRSLTVLEGLALYTDPNFKVLAASYPYFAKRLLTDKNPYLRDALIELLFKDGTFRYYLEWKARPVFMRTFGSYMSNFVSRASHMPGLKRNVKCVYRLIAVVFGS